MWKTIADNLGRYRCYPRIVGETGGKDFIFMHASGDAAEVSAAIVRAGFEYQGQKCSACSRVYIPATRWAEVKGQVLALLAEVKMGDPRDFRNFFNAVIDEAAFDNTMKYIELARNAKDAQIIAGGKGDKSKGYFIEPTVILTTDPKFVTMEEEIFAPVVTIYVYDDAKLDETLKILDETSPYALTGAIFAKDRYVINHLTQVLANSAGNFYINDKPTGAVVGHQPFGGARSSGTNDKAGSFLNLIRWTSPRTIKESFTPPVDIKFPFLEAE
jgi:1-pyrroline-5-carboxylate dehydrogenase